MTKKKTTKTIAKKAKSKAPAKKSAAKPVAKKAPQKAPVKAPVKPKTASAAPQQQPGQQPGVRPNPQQNMPIPHVSILAQYIKDLSFENPNAPRVLAHKTPPKMEINVDLRANAIQPPAGPIERPTFEVALKITAKAVQPDGVAFLIELTYAGVFVMVNIPQKDLETSLLVYCPNLLFPFARQVVATATRDGGFPPLMLEPIDFGALYVQRKRMAAAKNEQPN